MNIFIRELKANFKSLLIWSGIVILFTIVGFSKFSAYYNNPELLAILDSFPPALLSALSVSSFNLTTVTGFYGIMIVYFGLILSIAAVMWGSDIISKEERAKTVEYSLTLPVTRAKVITAKTAAVVVNSIILLLVCWGIMVISARQFNPDNTFYKFVALSMVAYLFMQLIFISVGVFLGCALKRYKLVGSAAISILLTAYFASIMAGLTKDFEFLKYFSPFKYFDPTLMLNESRLEFTFILLSVGIIVLSMLGAYLSYKKRDLYI